MSSPQVSERAVGLVFDDRYLAHNTGLYLVQERDLFPFSTHYRASLQPRPGCRAREQPDNLTSVTDRMTRIDAYEADDEALLAFHTPGHLKHIAAVSKTGGDAGEGAPIGIRQGDQSARLAVGGAMAAIDAVLQGEVKHADMP